MPEIIVSDVGMSALFSASLRMDCLERKKSRRKRKGFILKIFIKIFDRCGSF